ncbi:DUF1254 domain-containing protein [Algoriphagus litoralis]|uniref:DUF1254 domain-containing protein n=1 Tax=Algoriphagus litoralis TaxID=2202829 RepID=UPI000DBA9110|nr:DUF1254 domain-containing protein [Algoriphagus litoralis]
MKRISMRLLSFLLLAIWGCQTGNESITPEEARTIAKEAYIYGFPLVDNYRISYAYFVDEKNPEYKGPWNQIRNFSRVFTPEDKAVQTPNSDTYYSFLGLDLRTEPIVLTVPSLEKNRYFSLQLVDAYTFNFDYIGTRTTGNDGGKFLIAGPNWKGEQPEEIEKVIYSETELVLVPFRTQLFNPDDSENVVKIQEGYKAQPLSEYLGQSSPEAAKPIEFIQPLTPEQQKSSLDFFKVLNFTLQFCPTHSSEMELMERFSKIGVGANKDFDAEKLSPEIKAAIAQGMEDAWTEFAELKKEMDAGKVVFGDCFGTREFLKNNYLYRMAAAVMGIYGNSKEEAMYPMYAVDSNGNELDGNNKYMVKFSANQLPPANAFWSLTMYELPSSLLYANPINRYLLNSPMIPDFKRDPDGGLTLYIQNESPGKELETNWLPAPKGPFLMVLRIYWPKEEALNGTWKQPALVMVN